jgi:hypothetical protein
VLVVGPRLEYLRSCVFASTKMSMNIARAIEQKDALNGRRRDASIISAAYVAFTLEEKKKEKKNTVSTAKSSVDNHTSVNKWWGRMHPRARQEKQVEQCKTE